jgi:hypothetical protein
MTSLYDEQGTEYSIRFSFAVYVQYILYGTVHVTKYGVLRTEIHADVFTRSGRYLED